MSIMRYTYSFNFVPWFSIGGSRAGYFSSACRGTSGGRRRGKTFSEISCASTTAAEAIKEGKSVVPSGLMAVHKPIGWSSNDVVAKIR